MSAPQSTNHLVDEKVCRSVTRTHARTFFLASSLLPAEKRRASFALYAFCRAVDDAVDVGASSREGAESTLGEHRLAVQRAQAGHGDTPEFRELAWAVRRFHVPLHVFDELLRGVATDLTVTRYASWTDLEAYCQGVASSVGEMCAYVFGVRDPASMQVAVRHARTLGVAMQLTNILRDVGEDALRGRVYLPADELTAHGLTVDSVLDASVALQPGWKPFLASQIDRARAYYRGAAPGYALLDGTAAAAARACGIGYEGILDEIAANDGDVFSRRARLGWGSRLAVLARAIAPSPTLPAGPVLFATRAPNAPPVQHDGHSF